MNRPIKFRAWDGKKMVRNFHISPDGVMLTEATGMKYDGLHETNSTIMQFCGLLDKNGKEIYEGDVVQTENTVVGQITFYSGHFMLDVGKGVRMYISDEYEVIGNIYENPELLTTP